MLSPTDEQRRLILKKIGFEPFEAQQPIIYDNHQIVEMTGGVRSGKSETAVSKLTSQFWLGELYWLVGADYQMCRREFAYLVRNFQKLGLIKPGSLHFPQRDQCSLEVSPNILIETKSSKYPEKIAAEAPDGIIICEAAQVSYDIFLRCLERLAEKDGWLFMEGTLEFWSDWYADLYNELQIPDNTLGGISYSLPSWTNLKAFPRGRQDPKILRQERILGQDFFMTRFGGIPLKPRGTVLPEFRPTLHTGNYHFNSDEPIYIGVDPGYYPSVYAVLAVQFIADHIYTIDEIYEQFLTTEQIINIVKKKPWYANLAGGAIDIASQQRGKELPTYDIWKKETGLSLDTRRIKPVSDGVNRLRTFMLPHPITHEVQLHINQSCRGLISEFGGCRSPIEGKGVWRKKMDRAGNVLSEEPDERNCDSSKALIYCVVSRYGLGPKPQKRAFSYINI